MRKFVDKEVTIEFVVQSSRTLDNRSFSFLNSEKSYRSDKNFTAAITKDGLQLFADKDVKDPAEHFKGKKVRVTGKVTLHRGRPQIKVEKPDQLRVVKSDAGAKKKAA